GSVLIMLFSLNPRFWKILFLQVNPSLSSLLRNISFCKNGNHTPGQLLRVIFHLVSALKFP
uniref:Uncharacterized protein n=1 Tax=Chelydra serpentina TaxID=8475 RepID=A0A8C3S817_CHESE